VPGPRKTDLVDVITQAFSAQRPDLPSELVETVTRLIYVGKRLELEAERTVQALALQYSEFDVIGMLRTAPPPHEMTPNQIRARVMLSSGAMTAVLKRLEAAELVSRRTDTTDRRMKHVRLTEAGINQADRALSERYARAAENLKAISKTDCSVLNAYLRAITDAIDESDQ